MLLGSEGTLGGDHRGVGARAAAARAARAARACAFADFAAGAQAVRAIVQAGPAPANCRLIDAREAALTLRRRRLARAAACSASRPPARRSSAMAARSRSARATAARRARAAAAARATWRDAFLRAPYLRDTLVRDGRAVARRSRPRSPGTGSGASSRRCAARPREALRERGAGRSPCRLTHAYPDGAAPYFTVLAPAARGAEVEQLARGQGGRGRRRSLAGGGTITHHHAVGRDHRPWYDRQRPEPFAAALRAAKAALDPRGLLNPGVLFEQR